MELNLVRGTEVTHSDEVVVTTEAHGGWSKGWCAKVLGVDPDAPGGLALQFLAAEKVSLSRAGNGKKYFHIKEPGVYMADSVYRSYSSHRVAFTVAPNGNITVIGDTATQSLTAVKNAVITALT